MLVLPFAHALTSWLSATPQAGGVAGSATVLILFVAAALATALPARRALRVDPMVTLRHE